MHTINGMSFNRTQSWATRNLYATLERWAARKTHRIITVARAMIDQSVAAGVAPRERFSTVYSGMEVDQFDPDAADRDAVRREWGVDNDHVVVGTVARLFRRKGYEQLVPIMAKAATRNEKLRFVWVGDGAQRQEYEVELARLGLADRTTLTGLVRPTEIPRLMGGMDILAHTSQWEGLPRGVVQSLLMRVPAIAFAIDGTPEVVLNHTTGRLIPLNHLDAFADALVDLAGDSAARERMGRTGREKCLARFDWRVMVEQIEATYVQLVK